MHALPRIYELRQYTLHPGRRDDLIGLFERAFMEPQYDCGIGLDGLFTDPERPDHFIWLRSFADMEARAAGLTAFYGGAVWKQHRDEANATMIDSDNVLLLRGEPIPATGALRGPLYCAIYTFDGIGELECFEERFRREIEPALGRSGADVIAVLRTHEGPNNFPQLPVREGSFSLVALVDGADPEQVSQTGSSQYFELVPTARSAMQYAFAGAPHDFDFLAGTWHVAHRRLQTRLSDSHVWTDQTGSANAFVLLDGLVSTDEITMGNGEKGTSFRNLDRLRGQWFIRWVNNRTGELALPVRGGFRNGRGEFYGHDRERGIAVLVRYVWSDCDGSAPQWEQAFSIDGGRSWETNWTMRFTK